MNEQEYLNKVIENEDLNALINDRNIYYNTSFKNVDLSDRDFLDWLSPLYFNIFLDFLNEKNEIKVVLLLNKKLLCNNEYRSRIVDEVYPIVEKSFNSIIEFEYEMSDFSDVEKNLNLLNLATSKITSAVFNNLNDEKIVNVKERIIPIFLRIQNKLIKKNLRKDVEVQFYLGPINNFLKQAKLDGELKIAIDKSIDKHSSKLKRGNSISFYLLLLGVVYTLLRVFAYFIL